MPPFFEHWCDLRHTALGIPAHVAAPHVQQGGGWRLAVRGGGGGAWAWKPLAGKHLSPVPEIIGAGDLTQAKVFSAPGRRLMRSSHWELMFLRGEERGLVKLQRTGRKLESIPQWESILGGVYDPAREASYEGAVEGLTITRPAQLLARVAPATSSTAGPTGAAPGAPPSASANVRTSLGAMGTIGPEPDSEVFAFIIRS